MPPVTARGRTSPMLPWSGPGFYRLASIVCWVSSASAAKLNLGRDARQLQDGTVESEVTAGSVEILTDDGRSGCCRTGGGEEQHYQDVAAADSLTQCEADCAARGLCLGYEWCETRPPGVLWSMSIAPRPPACGRRTVLHLPGPFAQLHLLSRPGRVVALPLSKHVLTSRIHCMCWRCMPSPCRVPNNRHRQARVGCHL